MQEISTATKHKIISTANISVSNEAHGQGLRLQFYRVQCVCRIVISPYYGRNVISTVTVTLKIIKYTTHTHFIKKCNQNLLSPYITCVYSFLMNWNTSYWFIKRSQSLSILPWRVQTRAKSWFTKGFKGSTLHDWR